MLGLVTWWWEAPSASNVRFLNISIVSDWAEKGFKIKQDQPEHKDNPTHPVCHSLNICPGQSCPRLPWSQGGSSLGHSGGWQSGSKVSQGAWTRKNTNDQVRVKQLLIESNESISLVLLLLLQVTQLPIQETSVSSWLQHFDLCHWGDAATYFEMMISCRISPKVFWSSPFTCSLPSTGMTCQENNFSDTSPPLPPSSTTLHPLMRSVLDFTLPESSHTNSKTRFISFFCQLFSTML